MSPRRVITCLLVAVFLVSLYSYKLLEVPTGLTSDEAAFGYDSVLIANTARDENGRFLPVFIRHSDTADYHQPVTQYLIVALFKLFGPSVYLLRFSSVLVATVSVLLLYFLTQNVVGGGGAIIATLALIVTPQVMLQAHMGQENIMPVPFVILWLLGLCLYRKNKRVRWLVISALALGISFYTYKGMRAVTPVWLIISAAWLAYELKNNLQKLRPLLIYLAVSTPFFLLIPVLEHLYPGAIFGGATVSFNNIYDFLQPYFSSFDISYLFIRGDIVDIHSTGRHGMLLLSTLPLILVGIYAAARSKDSFKKFILIALFLGPLLYGLVGSIHRFSRLMALIPFFALLTGLGWQYLMKTFTKYAKPLTVIFLLLIAINYQDFARYYWQIYPPLTFSLVGNLQNYNDVARFAKLAREKNLVPLIHKQISEGGGVSLKFFEEMYFGHLLKVIPDDNASGVGTILLTQRKQVSGMKEIPGPVVDYHIQLPQ